ncbi:MAG: primosomal protein N' [Clostridia bacterium]|nr:primosomal protein N' [Clostridia bacterium]
MVSVGVAVEGIPRSADKLYEYLLDEGVTAPVGSVVTVPFGRSNKPVRGVVLGDAPKDGTPPERLKTVVSVGDCYLSPEAIDVIRYMRDRYFCTWFEAARCLLPTGVFGGSAKSVLSASVADESAAAAYMEANYTNRKHCDVLGFLLEAGQMTVKELTYMAGVSESVVKTLAKKGLILLEKAEVLRNPLKDRPLPEAPPKTELNREQTAAAEGLISDLNSGRTHLLYGVTGSGKTHVFIRLIDEALKQGKQAVLMIPEISLTLQIVNRLYAHYAQSLAVLHSGLSMGERYDEWHRIRRGEARVVIGTRSSVFAPVCEGSLFIIDEEQEHTYKSEASPRYHAREIAAYRAARGKGLLLLASATPSFESYYRAQTGVIGFAQLTERFNGRPLPKVLVADLRREMMSGNRSCIGRTLGEEIEKNLQRGEQAILFMNRRGYQSHITCTTCNAVVKCPHCGIAMTYHSYNHRVVCNYCGYSTDYLSSCASCGGKRLLYSGVGTQKAEEELFRLFPNVRVCRMDADTVGGKYTREGILNDFRDKKYDILLGTQMITKGLDFPDVTLVGVLNADMSLYTSDFRAFEKTFSLLTQVVGRAGRAEKEGRAVVQTYSPAHYVLHDAFAQDYEKFYREEMSLRKSLLYPPYCDLCQFCFLADTETEAFRAANDFSERIREKTQNDAASFPVRLILPKVTAVPLVGGKTRVRVLMKCKDTRPQRQMISDLLDEFRARKENRDVTVTADMNPVNIL